MNLRPAVPEDAPALGILHVRCWREAYRGIVPDVILDGLDPELRAKRFAEIIAGEGRQLVLAEEEGEPVGFVTFGPAREVDGWGEVYAIYLRASSWGKGIGSALLREAERALARSFDRAMLWVLTENARARAFYERHGWYPSGIAQHLDFDGTVLEELRYDRDLRG